ncbi:MGT family glycosyltransferase [Saccharothrix tamanrassetensis]|uniref:MGT family glycosyltransferase n=1 Tax=Saccharothrix tamanrassetensis TaxID=1051531 RepID=A0A841CP57_9PSEU|nr:macrolide family glycosyltransferase [Saccharothrix tamanrassetensis]MBB5957857.1 MGT family glycosyltransferase [Saccharothrix tamanrassetensis]
MSHIAFLNIPGHGHINPTLPVVTELVARGHRVTYAVPAGFTGPVEHAGAVPVVYPTTLPVADQEWPTETAPAMKLFLDEAVALLPVLEAAYADDRPDVVVYDIGAWTARILAARWGVRAIQFSPTFVAYEGWEEDMGAINDTPEMKAVYAEIGAWLRSEGVTVDAPTFVGHPDRAVVSIPRSFQYGGDTVADKYTFVGPCIGDRSFQGSWHAPADGRPVLLVSLGSAYTNEPSFYRACLEAFGDSDWHVVMNIGKHVDRAALGPIPANFEVHRWLPQLEILSHAKVFITHCGMGGTMEGLYHGVPMVGVPTLGEQAMNAMRLVELGVGRYLPHKQVTAEALREAVRELAGDRDVADRLAAIRSEIRAAGGTAAAADVVEEGLR